MSENQSAKYKKRKFREKGRKYCSQDLSVVLREPKTVGNEFIKFDSASTCY